MTEEALQKPSRLVIGLMSGTSADGVDAALCRIFGHGTDTRVEQRAFVSIPYSEQVRGEILRLAGGEPASAADFCRISFLLGELFAEAAQAVCRAGGADPREIDLIGSHGQTFWHQPAEEEYLGRRIRSTLQLGESAVLAERFSCPVVSDFRVRDVAAGGLGAPLVPYSEFLIYRSTTECVALQNIGGIANITCLPPDCGMDEVLAFDTGPGNMLIDAAVSRLTDGALRFDECGAMAAAGRVQEALLSRLMEDPYLYRKPPKTTGREYYGTQFADRIFAWARELAVTRREDLVATVTAYTARTIAYSVRHYLPLQPERLVIGGGGSRNRTLLALLAEALPACRVVTNEELGFDSDAKEAVAFAVLANEALFSGCNNVPSVTGAGHPVVMGKISL